MTEVACLLYFILYDGGLLLWRILDWSQLRQRCFQSQTVPVRAGALSGISLLSLADCSTAHVIEKEQQSLLSHGLYFAAPCCQMVIDPIVSEFHVLRQAKGC